MLTVLYQFDNETARVRTMILATRDSWLQEITRWRKDNGWSWQTGDSFDDSDWDQAWLACRRIRGWFKPVEVRFNLPVYNDVVDPDFLHDLGEDLNQVLLLGGWCRQPTPESPGVARLLPEHPITDLLNTQLVAEMTGKVEAEVIREFQGDGPTQTATVEYRLTIRHHFLPDEGWIDPWSPADLGFALSVAAGLAVHRNGPIYGPLKFDYSVDYDRLIRREVINLFPLEK